MLNWINLLQVYFWVIVKALHQYLLIDHNLIHGTIYVKIFAIIRSARSFLVGIWGLNESSLSIRKTFELLLVLLSYINRLSIWVNWHQIIIQHAIFNYFRLLFWSLLNNLVMERYTLFIIIHISLTIWKEIVQIYNSAVIVKLTTCYWFFLIIDTYGLKKVSLLTITAFFIRIWWKRIFLRLTYCWATHS